MPSTDANRESWGIEYGWPEGGDEWSSYWGSARAQWEGCLLPRIFPFLGGRILEIATGHGRWTQFLQSYSTSLIGIDIAPSCIERCKERFRGYKNLEFHVNDGLKLPMVDDASIDFAYSFDSLVHAEADAVSSYVNELARVLKPNAVAFIHHSNFAGNSKTIWSKVGRGFVVIRTTDFATIRQALRSKVKSNPSGVGTPHWRGRSMSAAKMREFAERSGMSCLQQELITWGHNPSLLLDCMSILVRRPGSECAVMENYQFMNEAARIKRISSYLQSAEGKATASAEHGSEVEAEVRSK
jgi:SAM-dependent methyltransferase